MDRPNAAIKILQMRASADDWHRKVLNHILHLEQELTVRDELLEEIDGQTFELGDADGQYINLPKELYNKLRDFIKQREKSEKPQS